MGLGLGKESRHLRQDILHVTKDSRGILPGNTAKDERAMLPVNRLGFHEVDPIDG